MKNSEYALFELEPQRHGITAAAIGHDPSGSWVSILRELGQVATQIYDRVEASFTPRTDPETLKAANEAGWHVTVDDLSIGAGRVEAIRTAMQTPETQFVHLWDGDRFLFGLWTDQLEVRKFVADIPMYDCLLGGTSEEGIKTHQPSMYTWEYVKSFGLAMPFGIKADMFNRGSIALSRNIAQFLLDSDEITRGDAAGGFEGEGIIAGLVYTYKKQREQGLLPDTDRQPFGYLELPHALGYEDWIFQGLTREESAAQKSTPIDFVFRGEHALRILAGYERVANDHGNVIWDGNSIRDAIKRIGKDLS